MLTCFGTCATAVMMQWLSRTECTVISMSFLHQLIRSPSSAAVATVCMQPQLHYEQIRCVHVVRRQCAHVWGMYDRLSSAAHACMYRPATVQGGVNGKQVKRCHTTQNKWTARVGFNYCHNPPAKVVHNCIGSIRSFRHASRV